MDTTLTHTGLEFVVQIRNLSGLINKNGGKDKQEYMLMRGELFEVLKIDESHSLSCWVYPNGVIKDEEDDQSPRSDPKMVALYLYLERNARNRVPNEIQIQIIVHELQKTVTIVEDEDTWLLNFVPNEYLVQHPTIKFKTTVKKSGANSNSNSEDKDQQKCQQSQSQLPLLDELCEHSLQKNGDIRIQIMPTTTNNNPKSKSKHSESQFSSPPNKKRKLNINLHSSPINSNSNSNSDSANLSLSETETESNNNNNKNESESNNNSNNALMTSSYVNMNSVVLKRASLVFDAMLNDDNPQELSMQEQQTKQIIIYCNSVKTVRDMFYFMWTNKLIDDANIFELFPLAHLYQVTKLIELCVNQMLDTLSLDSYVSTVNLFLRFQIKSGNAKLSQFGKDNLKELEQRSDFSDLPSAFVLYVLSHVS